jgi:rod shape-determining protein MreD
VAVQVLAAPYYRTGNVAPDFPLLALAYLGFFAPPRRLLAIAAGTALAVDALSLDPVGTRLLGYLPALWLINRARRTALAESIVLRAGLTLAACVIASAIGWAFLSWKDGRWAGAALEAKAALYTAIIGVGVHAAIDPCRGRLGWVRDRFFSA